MPKKLPPTNTDRDLNLSTLSRLFVDENAAREFLESKRWPNGPVCPHCGSTEAYRLTAREGSRKPVRPGVCKCKKCRKQFTVRVGTIFEDSKLPLSKWLMAIHLMTSSKKGVSSHQIARELDVTVKTAWFVTHRIRESMKLEPMAGMLKGAVEVDETYVGGKPRKGGRPGVKGRGTSKTPVLVLVERDGKAVCKPLPTVSSRCLNNELSVRMAKDSVLLTDEFSAYKPIGGQFDGGHKTVNHSEGEYARMEGDLNVHTNTAESFFALLKRGHYGIFHQLSKHHLFRYCNEFGFRWTYRYVTDGERMVEAIKGAEGKRLMYKQPVDPKPNGLVKPDDSKKP
jgi:transposase-like protein